MSLQTVTITPQYVNPPKEGKKYGSLKTSDGIQYVAGSFITNQCQPGVPVVLTYEEQSWSGKPVMVATKVTLGEAPAAAPASAPRSNGTGYTNGSNAEDIFVTGVVGRAMGSGEFMPNDIEELVDGAVQAYRRWKAGELGVPKTHAATAPRAVPPRPSPRDDLNDEIPW